MEMIRGGAGRVAWEGGGRRFRESGSQARYQGWERRDQERARRGRWLVIQGGLDRMGGRFCMGMVVRIIARHMLDGR